VNRSIVNVIGNFRDDLIHRAIAFLTEFKNGLYSC
jgi:hypothetical protein